MDAERLIDLEVKVAFQDDLLESLNRIVAEQQQQIELLRQEVRLVYQQVKTLQPSMIAAPEDEAPPPHY